MLADQGFYKAANVGLPWPAYVEPEGPVLGLPTFGRPRATHLGQPWLI